MPDQGLDPLTESPVRCSRCGAVRPPIEMARSLGATDDRDRYWCHGFTDAEPTCYMQANWDGEIWLADDA